MQKMLALMYHKNRVVFLRVFSVVVVVDVVEVVVTVVPPAVHQLQVVAHILRMKVQSEQPSAPAVM